MDVQPVTISDILPGEGQFIIPVFQRYYSWEEKDWETLWQDIIATMEDDDPNFSHFIGPMIVFRETYPHDIARYMVVDGQQRLVTLTILLCALRDVAQEKQLTDLASAIVNNYISFKTGKGVQHYRLVPRSVDRDALISVIEEKVSRNRSEELVIQAYRFFMDRVQESDEEQHDSKRDMPSSLERLNALYETITRRLRLVSITLHNSDDPTKIYESMNFKGEDLLDSDLIRNYVLMQLPIGEQDEFHNTQWMTFERLFEIDGNGRRSKNEALKELEDYYYRHLIAKTEYFPKRKLYYEFRNYADGFIKGKSGEELKNALADLVTSLKRFARFYRALIQPELERDNDLKSAFQRFGFLDAQTAIPFVISLYDRYEDESRADHISKDTFLQMMSAVESFTIRRSIMRLRTRGYGLDFAQAVKKSGNIQKLWEHFDDRGWPTDNEISETLIDFPLYLRERKKSRLILEELETSFGHKEQVNLGDHARIQIEHIMPQKKGLSPEWEAALGGDAHDIHERYHDTLGNLTLTGYNRELGAKSFADKKLEYAKHGTHLELNNYVLEQEQWTEAEIVARAKLLIERFIAIWPRPDRERIRPA